MIVVRYWNAGSFLATNTFFHIAFGIYACASLLAQAGPSESKVHGSSSRRAATSQAAAELTDKEICSVRAVLCFHFVWSLNSTASTAFVMYARRHLMVWALFAPKFVFDGVSLILTDVGILVLGCYYYYKSVVLESPLKQA